MTDTSSRTEEFEKLLDAYHMAVVDWANAGRFDDREEAGALQDASAALLDYVRKLREENDRLRGTLAFRVRHHER